MPFKYAPPSAVFFLPLLALPARAATVLWNLLSVGAFALTLRRVLRRLPAAPPATPVLIVLALAQPLFLELHYAQVDLLMLALLWYAIEEAEAGRPLRAGAAIAVAVLFKPPALLVLGIFARRRTGVGLAAFALVQGLLWLPFVARMGAGRALLQLHHWSALLGATTAPWALGYNPQGLPTALLWLWYPTDAIPPSSVLIAAQLGAVALFAGALFLLRPKGVALAAALCLAVALLSPLAWRANFVLAAPAVALALASGRRGWAVAALVGLCGALVQPGLWGEAGFREVMAGARPFALVFSALGSWVLWTSRSVRAEPEQPSGRLREAETRSPYP